MADARELYTTQHGQRTREVARLAATERRISVARLLAVAAGIAAAWFGSAWGAAVCAALFVALVVAHGRASARRSHASRSVAFYEAGIRRVDGTWAGSGLTGDGYPEEHHPYAADLDLFGRGSLYELLCIASTATGRRRLAEWLLAPARPATEIIARQEAVAELRDDNAFREEMHVVASEVTRAIEAAHLEEWGTAPAVILTRGERIAAAALAVAAFLLTLAALPSIVLRLVGATHPEAQIGAFASFPLWPALAAMVAEIFLARRMAGRVAMIVTNVERAEASLGQLARLLQLVERRQFSSARLVALRDSIGHGQASREIERLRRLVGLLDSRRNQFFMPIAALLLWTTNLAGAIESWRRASGPQVAGWIDAIADLEALSSLAAFAFEHPDFAVSRVVTDGALFRATALGHPLIPSSKRVTNDITLGGDLPLLVISGSNMSGKSTMMRSVGVAAVLAQAGAPVCAASLEISPLALGASIRIHDSIQEGSSRFYAEITRIRQIVGLAAAGTPLLFLLDEVLAGTNSHDRRIGAEAVIRSLVERGAIGLVSTHDLALAQIADALGPRAANVHFEDHIEDGRVVFDYRMRPGVVTKSNALALMRSVGLDV